MRDPGPDTAEHRFVPLGLLCGVIVLAALGVAAAVFRGLTLFGVLDTLTAEHQVQAGAGGLGIRLTAGELAAFDKPFGEHPFVTALHILPAFFFMTLAPFQFSSTLRARHLRFHRWSGRALVLLGIPLGSSGLFFGLSTPFGGSIEASGVAVAGTLFLFSMIKAVIAVRTGDLNGHRIWMTRAFGLVLSISMMRVVLLVLMPLTGAAVQSLFGLAVWLGFLFTGAAAELWLRHADALPNVDRRAA